MTEAAEFQGPEAASQTATIERGRLGGTARRRSGDGEGRPPVSSTELSRGPADFARFSRAQGVGDDHTGRARRLQADDR